MRPSTIGEESADHSRERGTGDRNELGGTHRCKQLGAERSSRNRRCDLHTEQRKIVFLRHIRQERGTESLRGRAGSNSRSTKQTAKAKVLQHRAHNKKQSYYAHSQKTIAAVWVELH